MTPSPAAKNSSRSELTYVHIGLVDESGRRYEIFRRRPDTPVTNGGLTGEDLWGIAPHEMLIAPAPEYRPAGNTRNPRRQ